MEEKDKITQLIVSRLGEKKRKEDAIKKWERSRTIRRYIPYVGVAVAACFACVMFLLPTREPMENGEAIRCSSPNVQLLVDESKWIDALAAVEMELAKADSAVRVLSVEDISDEEILYELEAEKQKKVELQTLKEKILKKMQ